MQDFVAASTSGSITLSLRLASWQEFESVDVERAESARGPFRNLATLAPAEFMAYEDTSVKPGSGFWYRLVLRDASGAQVSRALYMATAGQVETAPMPVTLVNGGPQMRIRYRIAEPGTPITLGAFDVRGQLVRRLERGIRDAGEHAWAIASAMKMVDQYS